MHRLTPRQLQLIDWQCVDTFLAGPLPESIGSLAYLNTLSIANTSMRGVGFQLPSWLTFTTPAVPPANAALNRCE